MDCGYANSCTTHTTTLPFTGLDLVVVVLFAVLMVALGLILRRHAV